MCDLTHDSSINLTFKADVHNDLIDMNEVLNCVCITGKSLLNWDHFRSMTDLIGAYLPAGRRSPKWFRWCVSDAVASFDVAVLDGGVKGQSGCAASGWF